MEARELIAGANLAKLTLDEFDNTQLRSSGITEPIFASTRLDQCRS